MNTTTALLLGAALGGLACYALYARANAGAPATPPGPSPSPSTGGNVPGAPVFVPGNLSPEEILRKSNPQPAPGLPGLPPSGTLPFDPSSPSVSPELLALLNPLPG